MIVPKFSTAIVYVCLIGGGLVGMFVAEKLPARAFLGLLFAYGFACFMVTKSWRSFFVLFVRRNAEGGNSRQSFNRTDIVVSDDGESRESRS